MTTDTSLTTPSPTGRMTISEPDLQYFPGTKEALAQRARMTAALALGNPPLIELDFGSLEDLAFARSFQSQA